jgi:creatinine amidohydrolase
VTTEVRELARMTTTEAAAALARARLAILPVGSCEQHGPHLTLDTDAAVAEALSRRLAARLGEDAVLCPPLPYGLSEHHLAFAGTLTLRPATLLAAVADLLESLQQGGISRVLIVNGHGGNIDALNLAARAARRDRGMLVASLMWAVLAADVVAEVAVGATYGHACETETSVAMALIPDRVRTDQLGDRGSRRSVDALTDPPAASVQEPVWLHEWSDDGALGDPQRADRAAGDRIVDTVLERAEAFARRLADRPTPEDGR